MALKLNLETLEHQRNAIQAVCEVFKDVPLVSDDPNANPVVSTHLEQIQGNIDALQRGDVPGLSEIPVRYRTLNPDDYLGIDVRMETGTGKTYTFTRLMLELNKLYGFKKFILLAPTTPIREGTSSFINSDYADRHFREVYGESEIYLQTLEAIKTKTKGRRMMPTQIREFAEGSGNEQKSIDVLLMTGAMLQSKSLERDDYEQTLLDDLTRPLDILRATRPVVIIDEPHRFDRKNKAFKKIVNELQPEVVIRFGATFPRTKGTKTKPSVIDYDNLVYDLGPAQAFNSLLVKGVKVQYPAALNEEDARFKVQLGSKKMTLRNVSTGEKFDVAEKNYLNDVHPEFRGIWLEKVGKSLDSGAKVAQLSNGAEYEDGMIIAAGAFSQTYQEMMIQQALLNHFDQEQELFDRHNRIKNSTLFFIDSVASYRGQDSMNDGWLQKFFEQELTKALKSKISELKDEQAKGELSSRGVEYIEYLQASLDDVHATHGGYFSEDNASSDDEIAEQVKTILSDKQSLMSFTNEDGTYNTRRFIFSKWTLREGWDLPNVFQIVKMRSSGSEVSKLQEVGRGLRLPVDEFGNRSTEDADSFYLTYLVDFAEQDFATRLVKEIQQDFAVITDVEPFLKKLSEIYGKEPKDLKLDMIKADLVDFDGSVIEGKYDDLVAAYPELAFGLADGRIIDQGSGKKDKTEKKRRVGIKASSFKRLQELWGQLSKKYIVSLEQASPELLDECVDAILSKNIYVDVVRLIQETKVERSEKGVLKASNPATVRHTDVDDSIAYGDFLTRAHHATSLPIDVIHRGLVRYNKKHTLEKDFINTQTLDNFILGFHDWFVESYSSRYEYVPVNVGIKDTALTNVDGQPRKTILRGRVGVKYDETGAKTPENYLYDTFVYDSEIEEKTTYDSLSGSFDKTIRVFGKIPRRSIQIPLLDGHTTSPDFMYVIEKEDGTQSLNLIVESKGVESDEDKRGTEKKAIKAGEKFFKEMSAYEDVDIRYTDQLNNDGIINIITAMLKQDKPS